MAGYNMSKWGLIPLTKSFITSKPDPEVRDGIKCYTLCPWFANTQLVRY